MGLRIKILLPLVSLSLLLVAYLYGYYMPRLLDDIANEHRVSVGQHIESVAEALTPLLLAHQLETVYENLDALKRRNRDWVSVRLFDDDGRMIYPLLKTSPPGSHRATAENIRTVEKRIDYLDAHLGKLVVEVDFAPTLSEATRRHRELMALMLFIIGSYVMTTALVLDRAARRPINLLAHASKKLAEGDFTATLPRRRNDEVGILVDSFHNMRETIRNYQAELKQSGYYNRSLIEASLDPLVTINAEGKITDVNTATETVTGCSRSELIGADFSDYFTDPKSARSGFLQAFRDGTVRDYPLEIRRRDGQVTSVLYNASVYRDEAGAVVGVFAAARDITERKWAEDALNRLNEELEERVRERTKELERRNYELEQMNKMFIGRELRMAELKERIRALEEALKQPLSE